ncbi:AraC family transcriptional regulator [Enterococcus sp. LJL98]
MQDYFFEQSFFEDFYLLNIGHQVCPPAHAYGPHRRSHFLLHFIAKGRGTFSVDGKDYALSQGDFFLIQPEIETFYQADEEEPWEYYWIGFHGKKVNEVLAYLQIDPQKHVGKAKNEALVLQRFESILRPAILGDSNQLLIQQYLFEILGAFYPPDTTKQTVAEEKRRYRYAFVAYVQHHYHNPNLQISVIAENFGLNKSYFSQVIKSEMGMTPNEYLSFFRMEESGRLFIRSEKSVKEVAFLVGYENPLTFSRAFKNFHGVSPLEYRKKHLKNSDTNQ